MADSLLGQAKDILGCTDADLGRLLGLNVSTVTAYIHGRRREFLNAAQIARLRATLAAYRDGVARSVDHFDLLT